MKFTIRSERIYAGSMSEGASNYASFTGSFGGVILAGEAFMDGKIPRSIPYPELQELTSS